MPAPIRSHFTIPYGAQFGAPRQGGRHHQGTDYHCPIGTPIYATGDGRVVSNIGETGYGIGFGNYVSIAYPGGRVTLDGHLRERSRLAVGTLVNSNTIVAYVGITGNAIYSDPPGSHDHHQLWINGVLADPTTYYGTTDPAGTGTPINPKDDIMDIIVTGEDGKSSSQPAEVVIADIFARAREIKQLVAGLTTVQTFDSGPQASTSVLGDVYARAREIRGIVAGLNLPAAPAPAPFVLSNADLARIVTGVADELARRSQA